MKNKILIIENSKTDFWKVQKLLKGNFYTILPNDPSEMINCIECHNEFNSNSIVDFTEQQIDDNFKELRLILCDIKLNNNEQSGDIVVDAIRKHRVPEFPMWTSLVPIIAITKHVEQEREDSIINAGADFSLNKDKIESAPYWFLAMVKQNVDSFERRLESIYPYELKEEIKTFKKNHANKKTAFIMTSFAEEHKVIIEQIVSVLKRYDITPCLANKQGGEIKDDLWPNVEVFMHGCDFGIGIYADDSILMGCGEIEDKKHFKRIRINPNMSQEVGYMLGLQKKVCIMKDKKLDKLPTDLAGKIYVEYDGEDDLKEKLGEWLMTKLLCKESNANNTIQE